MRFTPTLFGLLATLLAFGCNTTKTATADVPMIAEVRNLDTMTVTPEANGIIEDVASPLPPAIPNNRPVYREAYKRTHDLLHTRLDLRFNWEKEQVIGVATLKLTPLFKPSNELVLDAKGFTFNSIKTA
ncbi:MAG: alanyl aminopeptidase, partial [Bacteroidota bacterium]